MKRRLLESLLFGIAIWGYCLMWIIAIILAAVMELSWRAETRIREWRR